MNDTIEKHDCAFQNGNKNENEVYSNINRIINSGYYSVYKMIKSHLPMRHLKTHLKELANDFVWLGHAPLQRKQMSALASIAK
jgi:hypothetical protein